MKLLHTRILLIACLLAAAACSNVDTHGVDTHNWTVPVYRAQF